MPTIMTSDAALNATGPVADVQQPPYVHQTRLTSPAYYALGTSEAVSASASEDASQTGLESSGEEGVRKREMRLLKNREAARECRRKKKEYIKCLENRVAVLENQNKALIEELKTLKEEVFGKQLEGKKIGQPIRQ